MFTCLRCRNPFKESLGNCPICGKGIPIVEAPAVIPEAPEVQAAPEVPTVPAPKKLKPEKSTKKK
jgi:hypothetical protein